MTFPNMPEEDWPALNDQERDQVREIADTVAQMQEDEREQK